MPKVELFAQGPQPSESSAVQGLPHVLLVVDGFPKALGGGERVALRLASLLPDYGFRVSVLTFRIDPESSLRRDNAPCPVYLLPLTKTWSPGALRAALSLGAFLRRERISLVQTFFESSDLWAGLVVRLFSRAKLVWSRRDMGILRSRKHTRAYQALRALPHAVAAVSQRVADHVIHTDGVPASKVHVIYNGLDLNRDLQLQRADNRQQELMIATVGNIRRVKGHDVLIRAAQAVVEQFPTASVVIAGEVLEPDFFRELERLVQELRLERHVRFVGRISDLPCFLHSASIFVLPSRSEGFSNALVEAMAAGLPVVATDVGGNGEALIDGQTGFLIASDDPTAMTQALVRLCAEDSLRARFGAAGRSTAEGRFSADAMMRTTAQLYRFLLRG